jgi:hypothetical protein
MTGEALAGSGNRGTCSKASVATYVAPTALVRDDALGASERGFGDVELRIVFGIQTSTTSKSCE